MAIRFREGRRAPWSVYWKNPFTGKTEEEPYVTEAEAKKANSLLKHRLKFERESFRPEENVQELDGDTLEACYYLYLKEKRFSKKGLTWSRDSMRVALQMLGNIPIQDISRQHIEALKSTLAASSVKPVTVRSRLSVLRAVLRWCAEKSILDHAPAFPKLPPPHYQHFIPPTPEETAAILACASQHQIRVIILGSQLGIRVGPSELYKLRWEDVDIDRGVIRVTAARKRPDQPWREVPIRESLRQILSDWKGQDKAAGAEYVIHWKGNPVQSTKRSWQTALRRAGITRHIRPYDLRHAFATEAIAAGADVGTVAQIMGNDPQTMLAHYQHVVDARKRAVVEAMPDLPGNVKVAEFLRQKITAENTAF
ncbi:MAG: tyrosine-type recombinase/integrase [Desulfovibrionaceae bacterium]|nr:tyrosine-type recombinase/integrase [Desulfovibrionaceae bacterium]